MYKLTQKQSNELSIIDIKDGNSHIFNYFINDKEDGDFLKHTIIRGFSQKGNSDTSLLSLDFLEASINIPIFSVRFKDYFEDILRDEVQFFPIEIFLNNQSYSFYLCKIKKYVIFDLFLATMDDHE